MHSVRLTFLLQGRKRNLPAQLCYIQELSMSSRCALTSPCFVKPISAPPKQFLSLLVPSWPPVDFKTEESSMPAGPILSTADIYEEEQYRQRNMFQVVTPPEGQRSVLTCSASVASVLTKLSQATLHWRYYS